MNQALRIKTIQDVTRWQVMRLLDWNDQQYANFQFEQGYEYLRFWVGDDKYGFRELPLTSAFWAWWRNHWHRRDMDFVPKAKAMSLNERIRHYNHIHTPKAIEYTPQSVVMAEAYAKMIYRVTHEEVGQ